MSRTQRRLKHRNQTWTLGWAFLTKGSESNCHPGCTVCGKSPKQRRREKKATRRRDRELIAEQR